MTSSHPTPAPCQRFLRLASTLDRRSAPRVALLFLGVSRGQPARHHWILGSEQFVDRLRVIVQRQTRGNGDLRREERLLRGIGLATVVEAVCQHNGVDQTELARRGSRSPAWAALAYVARQHNQATLSELVPILALASRERAHPVQEAVAFARRASRRPSAASTP